MADDKPLLRARMRDLRRRLSTERGAAAALALAGHAGALPVDRWDGLIVSVYLADGGEIDPAPLARRLAALGARIALPVVVAKRAPLKFRLDLDPAARVPDAAGIPGPPPHAPEVRPDLVLAPLVAFDRFGGRLGQGGGFYDRTLHALRAEGPVLAIGVAYAEQAVDRLELAPHDARLDGVLTEDGYRAASSL